MTGSYPERRLEDLVNSAREDMFCEIKNWLDIEDKEDKARIARGILAIANFGGGFMLIGFDRNPSTSVYDPLPAPSGLLEKYDHDSINSITQKYCDPAIYVQCECVVQPTGSVHPVLVIPGHHPVPIRCKRDSPNGNIVKQNAYYIRRPGPSSEEIKTAEEWHQLIRRCVTSDRASFSKRPRQSSVACWV